MDDLEKLVNDAHDLFGDYSIFEVIDLNRPVANELMKEIYGPGVDQARVKRYFDVLGKLRTWVG